MCMTTATPWTWWKLRRTSGTTQGITGADNVSVRQYSFTWQTTLACEGALYCSYIPISDHSLKSFLKGFSLGPANWECLAPDHSIWRSSIDSGAVVFENNRIRKDIEKRAKRNARASVSSTAVLTPAYPC